MSGGCCLSCWADFACKAHAIQGLMPAPADPGCQVRLVGDFDEWTRGVELSASEMDTDGSLRTFEGVIPLLPVGIKISWCTQNLLTSLPHTPRLKGHL